MKKLILSIIFVASILSAQSFKDYTATSDSGSALSTAVTITPGYQLKWIKFPALTSGTSSFKLLVETSYNVYDTLWYDGMVYSGTISANGMVTQINANVTWGISRLKILLSTTQDTARTYRVRAIKAKNTN